jgi:DNA-binding NarL/FixJ family response regulator
MTMRPSVAARGHRSVPAGDGGKSAPARLRREAAIAPGYEHQRSALLAADERNGPVSSAIGDPSLQAARSYGQGRVRGEVCKVRLAIVESHPYLREGMRSFLASEADFEVVGTVAEADAALAQVQRLHPDVLVIGPNQSSSRGLETLQELRRHGLHSRTILLARRAAMPDVRVLVDAGARGILPDDHAVADLVAAIRTVANGDVALAPEFVTALAVGRAARPGLTRREEELLTLIARGHSNSEIGSALGIGVKTVDTHRRTLYRKLEAHNASELLMNALRLGLIVP